MFKQKRVRWPNSEKLSTSRKKDKAWVRVADAPSQHADPIAPFALLECILCCTGLCSSTILVVVLLFVHLFVLLFLCCVSDGHLVLIHIVLQCRESKLVLGCWRWPRLAGKLVQHSIQQPICWRVSQPSPQLRRTVSNPFWSRPAFSRESMPSTQTWTNAAVDEAPETPNRNQHMRKHKTNFAHATVSNTRICCQRHTHTATVLLATCFSPAAR